MNPYTKTNFKPLLEQDTPKNRTQLLLDTRNSSNWKQISHDGWALPGSEEKHDWCGNWLWEGCLNISAHGDPKQTALDGQSRSGKIYVRHFQRSCYRACCEYCVEKWLARESNAVTVRLVKGVLKYGGKIVHVIASPPSWIYGKEPKELRRETYKILNKVGIKGGACVFHPFRFDMQNNCWYYSPHFHILASGWIENTKELYSKEGWIVKNLGVRKTPGEIFATIHYELSHAGIRKKTNAVTWFGKFSYRKLKVIIPEIKHQCPLCKADLVPLDYTLTGWCGADRPPPEEFEGFVGPGGFVAVPTKRVSCI